MCSSLLIKIISKIVSYARAGCIYHARKLFDQMPHRDTVAWNSMLTSYSQLGLHQEALSLFRQMRASNIKPDHFTCTATLSACASAGSLLLGTKIHALVVVLGYHSSLPANNSLVDMYGKCFCPWSASQVFDDMVERNEVTWCSLLFAYTNSDQFNAAQEVFNLMPKKVDIAWNVMIASLGRCGNINICLGLFKEMRKSSCNPEQWTYSSLINACTEASEFFYGCMIHAFIIKSGWSSAVEATNSVLSFYAKLDSYSDAVKVFASARMLTQVSWNAIIDAHMKNGDTHKAFSEFQCAPEKNVVSWTSMISGYARNGCGEEALSFFASMMRNCLVPDDFTFAAVLLACSILAALGHGKMVHGCVIERGFHSFAYIGNGLVNMYAKCGDIDGSVKAFNEIYENKDLVSFNAMLNAFALHGRASQALQLYEDMLAGGRKPDKVTFISLLVACSHSGLIEKGRTYFESMKSVFGLSYDFDHVACMVDMLGRGGFLAEATELTSDYSKTADMKTRSYETLLGACSSLGEIGMGTRLGEALKVLETHNEMSYVLQSNLYCSSGQWKKAEMVRKAMVEEGLKKTPGCSWIEVRDKVTGFVAGQNSHPHAERLYNTLYLLDFEMRNSCFIEILRRE